MLKRRQLFQFAGVAAVAAAGGAAWMYYGLPRSEALVGGPFGVLDVAGPLKIRATAASFPLLPGRESPFLLYQTEQAGKAYQKLPSRTTEIEFAVSAWSPHREVR